MRMKMIPPPMEIGRLCGQGKRVSASPDPSDRRREERTYKCTAVMILDTPHWICITFA